MKKNEINKLDKLFSLNVRSIGMCEWCGKSSGVQLQCAHIHSRTYHNTRWMRKNAKCLCAACHRLAHNRPTLFTEWIKKEMGEEEYNQLNLDAMKVKFPKDTYEDVLKEIQNDHSL